MCDFDLKAVDSFFPHKQYRPGQKKIIERALESFRDGFKYVFIDAPTGSGKSAIGFTVAQFMDSSFILCPQKFLQDQLSSDFGENGKCLGLLEPMVELKGRNAYPCNYWDRKLEEPLDEKDRKKYLDIAFKKPGCDVGQCKRDGKSKLKYCVEPTVRCPYFIQLYKAQSAKICLMNFHSFLFQSSITKNFDARELLILDECHLSEDILLKFIEFKISDRYFVKDDIKFPKLESVREYIDYFVKIRLEDLISEKLKIAKLQNDFKDEEEWEHLRFKLSLLMKSDPDKWVCIWEEVSSKASRTVSIKPIFIDEFAHKYLFDKADYVLFMSATVLSKDTMCSALGINKDEAKSFRLPSYFPVERRKIYYRPCGSMSYKNKAQTHPKMIKKVNHLCRHHKDDRGIIHTHNFEIAYKLVENCDDDVKSRFLFQKHIEFDGDKKALLDVHAKRPNSIIVAPAMTEGLSLDDDLGRFAIIAKVPFQPLNDPQIKARLSLSQSYYNWLTMCKFIQSAGRIMRHDKDYGVTYVLDSDFENFYKRSKYLVPDWFRKAIVWE